MRKDNKGFTLIELVVVIAIMSILFLVVIPRLNVVSDKAKETGIKTDFRTFEVAIEQVMIEQSGMPFNGNSVDEDKAMEELNKVLDDDVKLKDKNTFKKPDPWEVPYKIDYSVRNKTDHSVIVKSFGKSGDESNPDYTLVVHYINGSYRICTDGLSKDMGEIGEDNVTCEIKNLGN